MALELSGPSIRSKSKFGFYIPFNNNRLSALPLVEVEQLSVSSDPHDSLLIGGKS